MPVKEKLVKILAPGVGWIRNGGAESATKRHLETCSRSLGRVFFSW